MSNWEKLAITTNIFNFRLPKDQRGILAFLGTSVDQTCFPYIFVSQLLDLRHTSAHSKKLKIGKRNYSPRNPKIVK